MPTATKSRVHRDAVKLFETMSALLPGGEQRLEMKVTDIGRQAGRPFVVKGELDETRLEAAWKYLRDSGSVTLAGPRFKVLRAHPEQTSDGPVKPKRPKAKREAPRVSRNNRTQAAGNGVTSEALRHSLDSLLTQIDRGLSGAKALREEAEALQARLAEIQERHNQLISELALFRQDIRDPHLAAFVDEHLGDELWAYEVAQLSVQR